METLKTSGMSDEEKSRLRLYAIVAGVLIVAAVLSSILTGLAVRPGHCGGIFQQQRYNCTEQMAYSTSNASMCAQLSGSYADQCYVAIAQKTGNLSTCRRVTGGAQYGACVTYIANKTRSPSICFELNSSMEQSCDETVALSMDSPNLCVSLSNNTARLSCISAIYMSRAFRQSSGASCQSIQSDNSSGVTFGAVALLRNSSYANLSQIINYMGFFNTTMGARDLCYLYLAYGSMNSSYCGYVSANASAICNYTAVRFNIVSRNATSISANYTQFLAACEQQADPAQCQNTVQYLQALSANSVGQCRNLTVSGYVYQCYFTLAQKYNDTRYCSYIANSTINSECLRSLRAGYNSTLGSV